MKPFLLPLLSVASFGCFDNDGSGKVVREHRTAPMFDRVEVAGTFSVLIEIDDEPTVVVETDDNLQKHVTARVTGKTLRVEHDDDVDPTKLIVRITTPELESFESSGATHARIRGIDGERFELDTSGAAKVEVEGEVELFVIDASGAAEIDAEKLIAERVEVDGSGAAELVVHASDELIADISGAGELAYAGDPDVVKTDVSGAATIRRR
jgi:hypothetical protein